MRDPADVLREQLLTAAEAEAIDVGGGTDAAVLVAMFGGPERPGLVFTERRADLRRHAGEISFPGGRRDHPREALIDCALREASEEIGLEPSAVEVIGALPPVSTVVTGYKVHPFVGLIDDAVPLRPNPGEVASVLLFRIDELIAGYDKRRLIRRGLPIRTDTYLVGEHLIWGATARILRSLLERMRQPG